MTPGPEQLAFETRRRITLRLVAPLMVLTFLNSLDRVNVSFAALQMNEDLGLDPKMYGYGVGILFFSYLLFQFPHTYILRKIGARKWIFGAVLLWGCIATSMAFIQNATHFYVLRFLLGMAESGFAPGVIFTISRWMPRRFRAWAIAGSMLAIPISIIFGGPLSGWLLTMENSLDIPGWRWMYLFEGGITIVAACTALRLFVDRIADAAWLTEAQKEWLVAELERDRIAITRDAPAQGFGSLLRDLKVWAAAGVWFSLMAGAYGIIYWLPQIIQQMSSAGDFEVSVLSTLPWIGLGAGLLLNAWHSDRTQERFLHIGIPSIIAAAGLVLGISLTTGWVALACLVVGGFGLGSAQGAYWALPTGFLSGANAANGITLINILGTSAGLITPPVIGWIRVQTGDFTPAVFALAGILVIGAALLVVIHRCVARPQVAGAIGAERPATKHA